MSHSPHTLFKSNGHIKTDTYTDLDIELAPIWGLFKSFLYEWSERHVKGKYIFRKTMFISYIRTQAWSDFLDPKSTNAINPACVTKSS